MSVDPGSIRIIDPTLTVSRQIHWDHRSAFAERQEIHLGLRSNTPYCVGIHENPIFDKRNSHMFYALFKRLTTFFLLKYQFYMHRHDFLDILFRNSVVKA